jgi:integrase
MRAKSSPLAVKAKRLALPIDKNPVFEPLGDGISVGYRRCAGAGTWVARRSDGKSGKIVKRIGLADDFDNADGQRVLSWAQAQAAALSFDPAAKTATQPPLTISASLDLYQKDLEMRGGDESNVDRLHLHVGRALLDKVIAAITVGDLRDWRDGLLTADLAPSTVNRISTAFKAALNLAADADERILSRAAWEKGLKALPDADEARNIILSNDNVQAIVTASYGVSEELGLLVEVAAVTGARYSQVANLLVGDLQDDRTEPRLMMPSAKKGKGVKRVLRRPVPISASLAAKLRRAAKNRPDDAPLLLKPPRPQTNAEIYPLPERWSKSDHYRPFKRAVAAALAVAGKADDAREEEESDPITIYALRHSSIVRQILAGVPVRVVAVMHDTSVQMIEKNYSKYLADHADALTRAALPDFSGPKAASTRAGQ